MALPGSFMCEAFECIYKYFLWSLFGTMLASSTALVWEWSSRIPTERLSHAPAAGENL